MKTKIVCIDTTKDGEEIATVKGNDGVLHFILVKLLPKKMRESYKGEIRNIYKDK